MTYLKTVVEPNKGISSGEHYRRKSKKYEATADKIMEIMKKMGIDINDSRFNKDKEENVE